MADKKKELDAKTEDPKYLYHLTQKYMTDYVDARGTIDDQIWWYELVLQSKKQVTRGDSEFTVLDLSKVRKAFAERFFSNLGKKESKKPSIFDIAEKRLAELKASKK